MAVRLGPEQRQSRERLLRSSRQVTQPRAFASASSSARDALSPTPTWAQHCPLNFPPDSRSAGTRPRASVCGFQAQLLSPPDTLRPGECGRRGGCNTRVRLCELRVPQGGPQAVGAALPESRWPTGWRGALAEDGGRGPEAGQRPAPSPRAAVAATGAELCVPSEGAYGTDAPPGLESKPLVPQPPVTTSTARTQGASGCPRGAMAQMERSGLGAWDAGGFREKVAERP